MADKEYTTLEERVELEYGLDPRASTGIAIACRVYNSRYEQGREVLLASLSSETEYETFGRDIMGVLALEAYQGAILRIKVEGNDNAAKDFASDLKIGLSDNRYLQNKFHEEYRKLIEIKRK